MVHNSDYQAFPLKPSTFKGVALNEFIPADVVVVHVQSAGDITILFKDATSLVVTSDAGMDYVIYDGDTITSTAEILMSK